MMKIPGLAGAFLVSLFCATLTGSIAHTQFVLHELFLIGVDVPLRDRLSTTLLDIAGLGPAYAAVMAGGLLVSFIAAHYVTRLAPDWRNFVYLVAGGVSIIVTLWIMKMVFGGITPIAGARSLTGLVFQGVAGAVAGYAFAGITAIRTRTT